MKQKISTRILLSMLAVALVPLVTIFFYITSRYSQDLKRSTLEQKEAAQPSSVSFASCRMICCTLGSKQMFEINSILVR